MLPGGSCTRYAARVDARVLAQLDVGAARYALVDARWPELGDEREVSLQDSSLLRALVVPSSAELQRLLVEHGDAPLPTGDALVERVAELVARRRLRVVRCRVQRPSVSLDGLVEVVDIAELAELAEDLAPDTSEDEATTWVAFRVVDDEGSPVAGRGFSLLLPDGTTVDGVTDADGRFSVESVASPGTCELSLRAS